MAEKLITVVRSSQLLPYTRHLEDCGANPATILRKCFCPINVDFEDPRGSIPTKRFWQLIEETARVLKDRQSGWKVAMKYGLQGSRYLGYQLENQASLRHALNFYVEIISKHSNSANLELQIKGSELWLTRTKVLKSTSNFPQVEQYYMGLLVHIVRQYLGEGWQPTRLALSGTPAPPQQYPLTTHCGDLITGAKQFGIAIPLDRLDEGPKGIRASVKAPGPPASPLPTENHRILKEVLHSYLMDYPLTRSSVSKILHVQPKTLARLLDKHDTNFSAIKNEALMERARAELESSQLSISGVAKLLHYSHQSAFTRAFEKSVGLSPQKFREIAKSRS